MFGLFTAPHQPHVVYLGRVRQASLKGRTPSERTKEFLMPSELFGTSVIFVKVAPGYVEKTLTTLPAKPHVAKAEAVFWRHHIPIAGGFRNTDELRAFASEVQQLDHVWAFRSYPALQDWTQNKKDGHASNAYLLIRSTDTQNTMSALKNVPEIQEII